MQEFPATHPTTHEHRHTAVENAKYGSPGFLIWLVLLSSPSRADATDREVLRSYHGRARNTLHLAMLIAKPCTSVKLDSVASCRLEGLHTRFLDFHTRLLDLHSRLLVFHPRLLDLHPRLFELNPRPLYLNPRPLYLHPKPLSLDPRPLDLNHRPLIKDSRTSIQDSVTYCRPQYLILYSYTYGVRGKSLSKSCNCF